MRARRVLQPSRVYEYKGSVRTMRQKDEMQTTDKVLPIYMNQWVWQRFLNIRINIYLDFYYESNLLSSF